MRYALLDRGNELLLVGAYCYFKSRLDDIVSELVLD